MTLDLKGLKNNLAELCSAVNTGELVPSVTGLSIYNANRGWGIVHRHIYTICSFSGKKAPEQALLKNALRHTAEQYEAASKTASAWLDDKKSGKETNEGDFEAVVFLASFHKASRNKDLIKGLQSLFQNQGGIQFDLKLVPEMDFYRRVDAFERVTGTPFPIDLIKKAVANDASSDLKRSFEEYEKKILEPVVVLSEEENAKRKARVIDKLVKIVKDLGKILNADTVEVFSLWGRMGCRKLLSFVSEKRKRELNTLDKFKFGNRQYPRDKSIPFDFSRFWTAVPLLGYEGKEVIVFHSLFAGAFFSRDRKEKEILPINPSKKYNAEMGVLLKKGHFQSWASLPLKDYESELIDLIDELVCLRHLPVDPQNNLMELDLFGFDYEDKISEKLNYNEVPFHFFIVHDFLFKACKKDPKEYIRLAKASKLTQNPIAKHIGNAAVGHFAGDEKIIKFAASQAGATEHDFQRYWIDPFSQMGPFLKAKENYDKVIATENYVKTAFGCYPFEGVLEYLFETATSP